MIKNIEVLLAATSYPQSDTDWRGVFIKQMLWALASKDEISLHYCGPPGVLPPNVIYRCTQKDEVWFKWLMENGGIAHLIRRGKVRHIPVILKLLYVLWKNYYVRNEKVSIYQINWLQNAIPLLFLKTETPALITVLGTDMSLLKWPGMTTLLRQIFKKRPCVLAPNADWMLKELNQRFGDVAHVVFIPLGIDKEWFDIKREVKTSGMHKWIVVSRLTTKKLGFLFEWGRGIFSKGGRHELHLFGPMQEDIKLPEWIHYHGATYPDQLRRVWFPEATGLITLSRHDEGRPQVMLEAMASGLPIIASILPAHENFLTHGETGWLARSQEHFQEGITWLSQSYHNDFISKNAKKWVEENIGTWRDCADRYYNTYCDLLGETDYA